MPDQTTDIVTTTSAMGFDETLARLLALLDQQGLRVFAIIDHQAAARDVGLDLRPTRVVIFGSPQGGTPLMVDHPLLALDLPLRILVWEGDDGVARLTFADGPALSQRYDVAPGEAGPLGLPARLAAQVAGAD